MIDFTKLHTMTSEEVAAIPDEQPDLDYIRRNTQLDNMEDKMNMNYVTIKVPDGYRDAEEFLKDCQFEQVEISTGDLFNMLLSRINFDGMDPRTFSLAELRGAIAGAEWPNKPDSH